MKGLLALAVLSIFSNAYSSTFEPESGMAFTCHDSVSNYHYELKIVDIGDEESEIKVYEKNMLRENYVGAVFNENSSESFFMAISKAGEVKFNITFPYNNLSEAFYADQGDSRALECSIK